MKVLLFKKTKDADLSIGQEVCYQDLHGSYTNTGTITDIIEQDGVKLYLLNTAMGAYMADELKLVKLDFNEWFETWPKAQAYRMYERSQCTGLRRAHDLMRQASRDFEKYLNKK